MSFVLRHVRQISQLEIDADKSWTGIGTPHVFTPAWLDSTYGWRKSITLTGTVAGAQNNYQVKFTINKGSGTDAGTSLYLNGNCKNDFSDLRFYSNAGVPLDYWIETLVPGSQAVVWVEVDTIPASPGTALIWLYYDKPTAVSASNGDATFQFFDDFNGVAIDPLKWATAFTGAGAISVAGGVATITTGAAGGSAVMTRVCAQPTVIECRMTLSSLYDASNQTRIRINKANIAFDAGVFDDGAHTTRQVFWNGVYTGTTVPQDVYLRWKSIYTAARLDWIIETDNGAVIYSNFSLLPPNPTDQRMEDGDGGGVMKSVLLLDWVHNRNYASPEPTVTSFSLPDYYRLNDIYMGIENIKEVAAGMALGDLIYHDGAKIAKLPPAGLGTQLITMGSFMAPGWGFADTGIVGYGVAGVIVVSADDSSSNAAVYNNAAGECRVGNIGGSVLHTAMRFRNITIPAGAVIVRAGINFVAQFSRAGQTVVSRVYAEKNAAPVVYGAAENFSLRALSTAFVNWTPIAAWVANNQYNSPDLTTVVQELVNAYAPYNLGVMAFQWRDQGSGANNFQSAWTFDSAPGLAPQLVIYWRYP